MNWKAHTFPIGSGSRSAPALPRSYPMDVNHQRRRRDTSQRILAKANQWVIMSVKFKNIALICALKIISSKELAGPNGRER